jgi:DNA-binding transcriptional LysR family regulator
MPPVSVNWDDLRFLLSLRRAGSLGAAARQLKVEASTVSRRLSSLEAALGTQLAARTPEGLQLNDAGELAAALAEKFDTGIAELLQRIGGDDQRPEGLVRLSATESMTTFLMRGLIPLRQLHPKIQIELVVSSAALDLMRREADVAVRLFREQNPALVARKLADLGWSIYASQDYVARTRIDLGATLAPGALTGHAIISYRGPASRSKGACWLAENTRAEDVVLTGDSVQAVTNAVKAGIGVSTLPCFAAHDDPSLVRLTPAVVAMVEAFAVIPPDHRNTTRVRLVLDAVVELFERERERLAGTAS